MNNGGVDSSIEKSILTFEPLAIANDKETFIHTDQASHSVKLSRQPFLQRCPLSVIDAESLKMIQVLRLHQAIDHTLSATGSAVLLRSLIQPSTDLKYIQSKQNALSEIASSDTLRQALVDAVSEFSRGETALYKFFNKGLLALSPYRDLKQARQSAEVLANIVSTLPPVASSYLKTLVTCLRSYQGSSIDQMMQGPIYKTFNGLKSNAEISLVTPKLTFMPHRFTKWLFAGPAIAAAPLLQAKMGLGPVLSPFLTSIGLAWTGIYALYCLLIKPVKDTGNFIEPLREKSVYDTAFSRAVDAIGMIDELLALYDFTKHVSHATVLPTIVDQRHHFFEADGLTNPILAKSQEDFIPNNVQMKGARLTFISGPNSGGKTTICKSIVHNQLLAQMGSYVLAQKAAINIADMISYQAPKFDGLQDPEGRFGTELSRTRDIFYATGPKSLVILDELAEGTTYEERLHESSGILRDFHTIGNNTVLVTHNHSLIEKMMSENKGQCFKVAFNGDDPTYRIVPGVSKVSHADRIARKINFSEEDRRRYLKTKGYSA